MKKLTVPSPTNHPTRGCPFLVFWLFVSFFLGFSLPHHLLTPRLPVSPASPHGSDNRVRYEFSFPVNAPYRFTASTSLGTAMDHAVLEDVV